MDTPVEVRLFRAHNTLLEMLTDRGYNIGDEHAFKSVDNLRDFMTEQEKKQNPEGNGIEFNALDFQYEKQQQEVTDDFDISGDGPKKNMIGVFWRYSEDKINSESLKKVQIRALLLKVSRVILIVKGETSLAKKSINDLQAPFTLEVFSLDDIQVNITKHILVPKHSVLSGDKKQELLTHYRIKDHQLPKIRVVDPIAKYFGVTRGDIMKIVRPSETAGRYVTYRVVM